MSIRIVATLALACAFAFPTWSQAVPEPAVEEMLVPPPVSERSLPIVPRAAIRQNFVSGVFAVHGGYTDNVFPGFGNPVGDGMYLFDSSLTVNQIRSRQQRIFTYRTGFALYQRTSQLNQAEHNGSALFSYRMSPHTSLTLNDVFDKSSSAFSATSGLVPSGAVGTLQMTTPGVIVPFAARITNTAQSELRWQFSPRAMLIGNAFFSDLRYPHPSEAPGVFDSSTREGSVSLARQLSKRWYLGLTGQYSRMGVFPHQDASTVTTDTASGFVTLYVRNNLSLSASGGPQRVESGPANGPSIVNWAPVLKASMDWQADRATFAATYSRLVTSGGGLIGAYQTTSGTATARWLITKQWAIGADGAYVTNDHVGAMLVGVIPTGHTKGGSASIERALTPNLTALIEYDRLNQSYTGVPALAGSPTTSRAMFSLSYQFSRPLGR